MNLILISFLLENDIKYDKENASINVVGRMSDINSKTFLKRRHEDTHEIKTPKKSFNGPIKKTNL